MKSMLWILCFASSCLLFADYNLNTGYDFATGEYVTEKREEKEGGRRIWLQRQAGDSELYRKYGLSHPEPLLTFVGGTGYTFEFFKVDTDGRGWRFWRYRYYFLQYRANMCWDGYSSEIMFFEILRRFSPSVEDAQRIFRNCIKIRQSKADHYREMAAYLQKEYDRYDAPRLKKVIAGYLADPDKNGAQKIFRESDNQSLLRYISEHRVEYPDLLPWQFYQTLLSAWPPNGTAEFCRDEYRRNPTAQNAFLAAFANFDYQKSELFLEYQRLGILDSFLQTVMPEILPPLLPPVRDGQPRGIREYVVGDYLDVPRREILLQWVTAVVDLKSYFRQKFNELMPCEEVFLMELPPMSDRPAFAFEFRMKKEVLPLDDWQDVIQYTIRRIEYHPSEEAVSILETIELLPEPPAAIWRDTDQPEQQFPNSIEKLIEFKDVNFDGYSDLLLHSGCGAQNHILQIYLYRPETKTFRYDKDFSEKIIGSRIDYFPEDKRIECHWHISASEISITAYRVIGGKLVKR